MTTRAKIAAEEPDPLPPSPAPKPEPEWRAELKEKIEGYRERQRDAGDGPELVSQPVPELPPLKPAEPLPQARPLQRAPAPPIVVATPPEPPGAVPIAAAPVQSTESAPIKQRAMAGLLDLTLIAVAVGLFIGVFAGLRAYWLPDSLGSPDIKTVAIVFFALLSFYWLVFIYYIGRTQGMFWTQLEVVSLDGQEPERSQRLMRAVGTIVSTASLGIGFAWALVDEEALTFHDNMSKTMIVESPE